MNAIIKTVTVSLALGASTGALAQRLELGFPSHAGTGCPQGTVSAALSPDNQQLSILFDSYTVESGYTNNRQLDRKSCNIAIPVRVPQGYSVSIISLDYRGFVDVPRGGRAQLSVDYFFAGGRGPRFTRDFRGPRSGDYLINNRLVAEAVVWSACGASTNLRTNTSLLVETNSRFDQAQASLDSIDVESGVIYNLQWRRCF